MGGNLHLMKGKWFKRGKYFENLHVHKHIDTWICIATQISKVHCGYKEKHIKDLAVVTSIYIVWSITIYSNNITTGLVT